MTIAFRVTGLNEVMKAFEKASEDSIYNDIIHETGKKAEEYAKQNAPVDSGVMEEDIQVHFEDKGFILMCNVPWAVFNEYGCYNLDAGTPGSPKPVVSTSGKRAFRPFMRPGIYKAMHELPELFGKKWAKIWK